MATAGVAAGPDDEELETGFDGSAARGIVDTSRWVASFFFSVEFGEGREGGWVQEEACCDRTESWEELHPLPGEDDGEPPPPLAPVDAEAAAAAVLSHVARALWSTGQTSEEGVGGWALLAAMFRAERNR